MGPEGWRRRAGLFPREADQQHADLLHRKDMIHRDERARAARHARGERFIRVLHDREPAGFLYRGEAGRAVVESAGEDHADDARPIDRAADLNSGPMAVRQPFSVGPCTTRSFPGSTDR